MPMYRTMIRVRRDDREWWSPIGIPFYSEADARRVVDDYARAAFPSDDAARSAFLDDVRIDPTT